jgi:hypothetical protein
MHGELKMNFSVVIPVKDELTLIKQTLWSYYEIDPSEVLVCTDKPCKKEVAHLIKKIAALFNMGDVTRIIEVKRIPEWGFHQAHVRRSGFIEAKYDRILTGDIDLLVNKNVYKALNLVGKNNIGLASLSKFHYPYMLLDYWRLAVETFLREIVHGMMDFVMETTVFSGLYTLWRPYWLDSEPVEEAKKLVNPKQILRGEVSNFALASGYAGEDTFLRDWMSKKHRCVYLKDVGAIDFGKSLEGHSFIQYSAGAYFGAKGRSLPVSIGRAILRAQPYYLRGYLAGRSKKT